MKINLKESLNIGVKAVGVIVVCALLGAIIHTCSAQSVSFYPHLEGNIWAQSTQNHQHTMLGEVDAVARWGPMEVDAFIGIQWYGSDKTKIPSSILNAEASKVLHRFHGLNAGFWVTDYLMLGGTVRRNAVHHVWMFKRSKEDRHNYYPGSWKVGRLGCVEGDAPNWSEGSPQCASHGYEDSAGPYVRVNYLGLDLELMAPIYQWKSLTFPWNDFRYKLKYSFQACANEKICELVGNTWTIRSQGSFFGPADNSAKLTIFRQLGKRLAIGTSIGREWNPDWKHLKLDRISFVLSVGKIQW